jgi:hypothetical protein
MITIAQTSVTGVTNGRPLSHPTVHTEELTKLSIHAVFQARVTAVASDELTKMERRDRIVLILLDGQRTIADVMRLLHRTEGEVAQVLVRLLKNGYIDFMGIRRT